MIDDRERLRGWMMAALDGEIGDDDGAELARALERDATLREEWDRMNEVKRATSRFAMRNPPVEVWESYWVSVYNRMERGLAWILVSAGTIFLLGWGAWEAVGALVRDTDMPGYLKIAVFAIVLGGILLGVSVVREKWFTGRRDPYKGVIR